MTVAAAPPAPGPGPSEPVEWSTERIAAQYRREIQRRFEAERAVHRAEEVADAERARREHPAAWAALVARSPEAAEPRESGLWEIYCASEVRIRSNEVRVLLPPGWTVDLDLVQMLGDASVAWARPSIDAEVVDGAARVVVEVLLVDSWDDDRAARHEADRAAAAASGGASAAPDAASASSAATNASRSSGD